MRPRGTPPTPRARSSATEPVDTAGTFCASRSPSRMIAPRPNCFSIWRMAASTAGLRSPSPFLAVGVWVATTGASIVLFSSSCVQGSGGVGSLLVAILRLGLRLAFLAPWLDDLDLARRRLVGRHDATRLLLRRLLL